MTLVFTIVGGIVVAAIDEPMPDVAAAVRSRESH
jgi:hypothetical protein